ncbi:MAG: phage tail length tape measure family protein [Rhizobiales bacterium]|nr:phage tail length tape measure family protein [Hyphomicrobiales bacterium]
MTDEIARLGVTIDTTQVEKGEKALDDFAKSAKPAVKATEELEAAAQDTATAFKKEADGATEAAKATGGMADKAKPATAATSGLGRAAADAARAASALKKDADSATKAATGLGKGTGDAADGAEAMAGSTGLARHELINLSRQAQDVVVSLQGGQGLGTVLMQQGSQIGDVFASSKGTVGGFARQVVGAVGPVRLFGLALAATAAASAVTINSIAKMEKAFDDVARGAGTSVAQLHALDSAAGFKGIDTAEFLKGMQQFGRAIYDAKIGVGGLAETFRANGKSAKDFTGYVETAADLIKNAGTDQQRLVLLQQMGLPATMEWVRFLSQGKDGIRAAIDEAAKFDTAADEKLIAKARQFDDAWNRATKNLGTGLRNAIIEGASWFDTLSEKGTAALMKIPGIGASVPTNILRNAMQDRAAGYQVGSRLTASSDVSDFYRGTGAGLADAAAKKPTVDPNAAQIAIARQQQQIGLLGTTKTVAEITTDSNVVILPPKKEIKNDGHQYRRAA